MHKFAQITLLTAAILTALLGCTTVGNWEKTYSSWQPTGTEKNSEKEKGTETANKKVFYISDLINRNNARFVSVNNSLWKTNYQIKEISRIPRFREWQNESRNVTTMVFAGPEVLIPLGLGLAGGIGGAYALDSKNGSVIGGGIGGAGGIGLGVYLMSLLAKKDVKIETRQTVTERTKEGNPLYDRTEKNFLNEGWVSQNNPAGNTNVKIDLAGRGIYARTDENGELNLSGFLGDDFFFSDQVLTKSQLEKIVRETSIVHQIKSGTLDVLLADLIKEVGRYDSRLIVSTDEKSAQGEKVENASRTFIVNSYEIGNDAVYKIVRDFVDKQINSYIKTLVLDTKDATSRIPINGTNFSINSDAPSKEELAGRYFTDNLMEFAQKQIKDYLSGESLQQGCPTRVSFPILIPSKMFYEVSQPDYQFVTGNFSLNGDRKEIIYMPDKGSKIRVQTETNKSGVTEEVKDFKNN